MFLAGAPPFFAQEPPPLVLVGQVMVGGQVADSGTVVLHHVSALSGGEVDSVAVAPGGGFRVGLPLSPDRDVGDVFFASFRYQDVLYFGDAITSEESLDSLYLIQAYPSEPADPDAPLAVTVRNLFLESTDLGWIATDLFEVRNSGAVTLVSSPDGPSWSHGLPSGATDFQVGQSDLPPDGASFGGGRLRVSVPIPPGESIYMVRYRVPSEAFAVPLDAFTGSMDLLIREPAGPLGVRGLTETEAVDVEGSTYRRFAGRDLAPTVLRVEPGESTSMAELVPWLGALLAVLLAGVGALVAFRSQRRGVAAAGKARDGILVEIVRLDEAWAKGQVDVEAYDRHRRRLLRRLE